MKRLHRVLLVVMSLAFPLFMSSAVYAHAVVKPTEVGIAAFQTFTLGVPNEEDNPTVAIRLVLPSGLHYVSPNVKPGWTIDEKKTGDGDNAAVTEISWTNGSIPTGQRDDFVFSAQAPDKESTLQWKAYQTYSDGKVVSWDQAPVTNQTDAQREALEKAGKGPYSQTKVVNDLANANTKPAAPNTSQASQDRLPLYISIAAVIIAIVALLRPRKA